MPILTSPDPASDNARAARAANLNEALLDLLALQHFARVAHWNVRGPFFGPLHALFGEIYDAISGYADAVAEHVAMLGALAKGTPKAVAEEASLDDYPEDATDGQEHLRALSERLASCNVTLKACMRKADDLGDDNGYQRLTDVSMGLEKLGWKLMARMQGKA